MLLELVLSMGELRLGGDGQRLHPAAMGMGKGGSGQTPGDSLTPTHPHHRAGYTNFTEECGDKLDNSFSCLAAYEIQFLSVFSPLGKRWLFL